MTDDREPDEADRSRFVANRPGAGGDLGPRPGSAKIPAGRPSKGVAIQAISDLLSRKKPAFDQLLAPKPARLPNFPRPLESTIADLKKEPGLRTKPGLTRTMLEPPPVELPGGGSSAGPQGSETPTGEPFGSGPSGPTQPASVASKSVDRGSIREEVGTPSSSTDRRVPGPRNVPNIDGPFSPRDPDPGAEIGHPASQAGSMEESALRIDSRIGGLPIFRDPGRIGGTGRPGEALVAAGSEPTDSIDIFRTARPIPRPLSGQEGEPEAIRSGVATSRSGLATVAGMGSTARADGSSIAVRNPLASSMASFPTGSQDFPGAGAKSVGLDAFGTGVGSVEPSFGGSGPTRGGEPVDLSRTNELLRQILDALKKQRDTSLPVGGQSVYPGR